MKVDEYRYLLSTTEDFLGVAGVSEDTIKQALALMPRLAKHLSLSLEPEEGKQIVETAIENCAKGKKTSLTRA